MKECRDIFLYRTEDRTYKREFPGERLWAEKLSELWLLASKTLRHNCITDTSNLLEFKQSRSRERKEKTDYQFQRYLAFHAIECMS